jgi:hypothetical protein
MRKMGSLKGVPTLAKIRAGGWLASTFLVFLSTVPDGCAGVRDVTVEAKAVSVSLASGGTLALPR